MNKENPQPIQNPTVSSGKIFGKRINARAWIFFSLLALLGIAIIGKVFMIQLFPSEQAQELAQRFTYKVNEIQPMRGQIFSSDGSLLATSLPEYEIRWDSKSEFNKEEFTQNMDSICLSFSKLFGDRSTAQYKALFKEAIKDGNRYTEIKDHVDYNELQRIKKFPFIRKGQFKSGFIFIEKYVREQPFGLLAARTIGMERKENKVGIELAYDSLLAGKKGSQMMEKIAGGIWKPMSDEFIQKPEAGCDIISTIDVHLQDVAHSALQRVMNKHKAEWGCAILMEVNTGFVRAIANLSNIPGSELYSERMNYAIRESVEPGSTMKLASLLACLDEGLITLNDTVHTGNGVKDFCGRKMKDSNHDKGGCGTITAEQVFEKSSNVGTAMLVKKSFGNNPQGFLDKLSSFGISDALGIDLPGETKPSVYKKSKEKGWSCLSLTQMSIGYEIQLTPLQSLSFYNAVANNGRYVRPQFIQEIKRNGLTIKKSEPIVIKDKICKDASIQAAFQMMQGVGETGGTAGNVFKDSPYKVAGKTGTAWVSENGQYLDHKYRASFVGFFPAQNPRYSCIVVINKPGEGEYYGGAVAAPVFKELADKIYSTEINHQKPIYKADSAILANKFTPPVLSGDAESILSVLDFLGIAAVNKTSDSEIIELASNQTNILVNPRQSHSNEVPNVTGMGLGDALYLLEKRGLKVEVRGYGKVKQQSLPPGTPLGNHQNIIIELI
jgi:cell division protein FtsI (penicillin-binding protein 3)